MCSQCLQYEHSIHLSSGLSVLHCLHSDVEGAVVGVLVDVEGAGVAVLVDVEGVGVVV